MFSYGDADFGCYSPRVVPSISFVQRVENFDSLTADVQKYVAKTYGVADINPGWQFPQAIAHGDLTTSVAMRLGKQLSKQPKEVAEGLAAELSLHADVEKVEVAGAGYVNLRLKPAALLRGLKETQAACSAKITKGENPVIVEYCSLNIAKPLGVHHILTTMIGQALANIYVHSGYSVVRWNYLGDWGTQFGKLFVAYKRWGKGGDPTSLSLDDLLSLYVKFHEEAEKDAALEEEGQAAFKRLEQGDAEVRKVWQAFVDVTKRAVMPVLERLQVKFDTDLGESHYENAMQPIIDEGTKKGVFKPGERGATIVEFAPPSTLPPAMVLKADGATNYLTRDLALARDRVERYNPSAILHVVGAEQSLHFQQLMEIVKLLGWEMPKWEHISFGRMRFADESMSTRKGNIVRLEEVVAEAVERARAIIKERGEAIQTDDPEALAEMMGVGALVYGVLSQNRKMDIVFDWDKMLSFEGNSAPYLQYAYARARSVLRKAEMETMLPADAASLTDADRSLIKTLSEYPRALSEALTEHMPHKLANYLYALAQEFNTFYNAEPILKSEDQTKILRLSLTSLCASVLRSGSSLLTLRLPERM